MKENHSIILEAIKTNASALQFASDKAKTDKTFILKAALTNGMIIEHLEAKFQHDHDIILKCIEQNAAVVCSYEKIKLMIIDDVELK